MLLIILISLNLMLVGVAVLIHFETLYQLSNRLPDPLIHPRYRVLVGVCIILIAHVVEIWLFAAGYYGMLHIKGMGSLSGNITELTLLECSYFSFITYTTVGYGDIVAHGYLRFLTGLEALTGFVLITWSASFLFLEMQKYWPGHRKQK
ncbi:MAG TPA: ion channel [Methylophilaceae bacterium]|nr:ion channel [Methylophilaceae bacterium]